MSALPSNLALVAEDLARATQVDARKSRRRRRLATYAVVFALLTLTASAAVASGWLFGGETPVVRVVPSLGAAPPGNLPGRVDAAAQAMTKIEAQHRSDQPAADGSAPLGQANGGTARTLLSGLGARNRTLSSVATTSGGACLTLTDLETECFATFAPGQAAMWFARTTIGRSSVVWGIVRDDVTAVDVVSAGGTKVAARYGSSGFYAELADGMPDHLILHRADGSSETVETLPCPLTTPDCDS